MPERTHALECPVCIGLPMSRIRVGRDRAVEVDICRRCGGLWLEHGELAQLQTHGVNHFALRTTRSDPPQPAHCHHCQAILNRDLDRCPACDEGNHLTCPSCDRSMELLVHDGTRLDVCRDCQGAWFDHHELHALWTPRLGVGRTRGTSTDGQGSLMAAEAAGDLTFHAFFFAPDLVGAAVVSAAEAVGEIPGALAASPEAAAGLVEMAGDAAASVFEAVVEIVGGVFG
jgi:Zn-finger nucleic acid-binding protein